MNYSAHFGLRPPLDVRVPYDLNHKVTEEQQNAIYEAVEDFRFRNARTFREQCYILCSLLHNPDTDKPIISYDTIGMLFEERKTHWSIIDEYKKYNEIMKAPHRPYLITDEELQQIEEELKRCKDDYPTIEDLSIFIMLTFKKYSSRKTIKRIVLERIKGYKLVPVKGIDDQRYTAQLEDIKEYYRKLIEEVKDVPVGFLFNLDESAQNQFVDARKAFPLSRSTRRITMLHCISIDGTSCDPYLILPRLTIDNEIFNEIPTGTVMFATQKKGYCTHEIFTKWFLEKFMP